MLQAYNPSLCRNIILLLGLFATLAVSSVAAATFFSSSLSAFNDTLLDEGVVICVLAPMTLLAFLNRIRLAALVWGFGMPFVIAWTIYRSAVETDILGVLLVIVIINGILLSPREVVVSGVLEFILFITATIVASYQPTADQPKIEFRAILINSLFVFFAIIAISLLDNGMLQVLRRSKEQTNLLQQANQRLQRQQAVQHQTGLNVSQLGNSLAGFFREQNSTTQEQAVLVNEVATTTQQLDSAARRIADNALAVAFVAEKALQSVEAGRKTAEDGTQAILLLQNRVELITVSVRALNNQIERISEVSNIIGEIAGETQLLALNAKIEAAGAREFGRRFATVAEEVNRLSRRVTDAVEQIQETVSEVTEASVQSLKATEDGLQQAKQGTELVEKLNIANQDVIQLVNQTALLASSIANATQEQHTASSQIVTAVRAISGASNQLAQMGNRVSGVVTALEASLQTMNNPAEPTQPAPHPTLANSATPTKDPKATDENLTYSTASS